MNFDSWMEDRINGDYGPELDRLDAQEDFQLTAPEGEDSDEDSLGDQTTNDSIEIEIVGNIMQSLDSGPIKFKNHPKPIYVWNGKSWEKTLM